jgi:hypothetical protein
MQLLFKSNIFLQMTSVANQTLFWSLSSSNSSLHVLYSGSPLPPSTHFVWRVRIRSTCLQLHAWSRYHMLITSLDNWSATYISPPTSTTLKQFSYARANFSLPCHTAAAALHISGIGYSVLHINRRRVGWELSPTWTRYDKMVHYVTLDITHLLRASVQDRGLRADSTAVCDHVIDVMLGSGHFSSNWYGGELSAILLAQINVQDALPQGGSLVVAATRAGAWFFTSDGPILSSSLYGGETVNATASYHEDQWEWQPAACAPPLPQYPSEPKRKSRVWSPAPTLPLQPLSHSPSTSSPAARLFSSQSSQPPVVDFDDNCSLAMQLNGSSLVPQRQVSFARSFSQTS